MKLISDIINTLVDPEKTLEGPFLKTKVFASKIKNDQLLKWINLELKGYDKNIELPAYRIYSCRLVADWINGTSFRYSKGTNMELPISGYDEEWQDYFTTFYFRQSILTLEKFLTTENDLKQLIEPLPADIIEIISRKIRQNNNPLFSITSASKRVSLSVVTEILSTLRSNLLDFMIKIDEEYGNVTDINNLSKQENILNQITNIMNQTLIQNTGDGNVVNTGSNNITTVTIKKGDFISLEKKLKENGIEESDIHELRNVIDLEKPTKTEFGPRVTIWIKKMLAKALDGSWKITIAVAGKLLADCIQQYYGH